MSSSLEQLHKNLISEFSKDSKNLDIIEKLLGDIKNNLVDEVISKLPPATSDTIHRDYFEISALFAILKNDLEGFETSIVNVQNFYTSHINDSTNKYLMIGLHLMFLLVKGKLSEFNTLIEQIDQHLKQTHPYIITPIKLQQYLKEGTHNKVFHLAKTIPSPYYTMFIRILTDRVRDDIAVSIEKSYKRILIKDAIQMLLYDNAEEALVYAEKRGWKREKDMFSFDALQEKATTVDASELPGMLETLESWTTYTESFLKHIEAAVSESDKNLSVRMQKEREIEKFAAQHKENGRTTENISELISFDGPKDTVKRSKRH
uniref:26S proteasome non-ATPase regulatory subunit 8 n=2 Tax=Panagrolaimus superbus TaxID=310955 RepID=A0A914Z227_9BILA